MFPVAAAFVVGQQRQARLFFKAGAFELEQGIFGAVQKAGLEVVECQCMLGAVAVVGAQVGAREQVLVHAHRALVFTTTAEQVAQRKVQLRRVGVVLYGFNEGVNGLVLLFVEQEVQAFEVGLGRLLVLQLQLANVHA